MAAILVPSIEEINSLPQKLTEGEKALMEALVKTLDEKWTVYVQPHLNGLRPDIVIFCEDAGIGIFEVKDWDLNAHRIIQNEDGTDQWQVRAWDTGKWHNEFCPLEQARKYKQSIFKYEIPILDAKKILDQSIYSLVVPFIYFHNHETKEVERHLQPIIDQYSNVFGRDGLEPNILKSMLAKRHLKHDSKFTKLMQENGISNRLQNALAYPKHGSTDIQSLLVNFNKKQKDLLPNNPGCRRVFGAAGAGKTLVLVHKAVNAAKEGKKVLVVCFNITMANYLRDLVTRLARHYGSHYHRNIEVGHFNRFFPYPNENPDIDNRNMKQTIDVLLIDEGQDFERSWIEKLQKICDPNYHLMFFEDDKQNIYSRNVKEREEIPIRGGKNFLKQSYRIPEQTAMLANTLSTWAKQEGEFGNIESIKYSQGNLFVSNIWFDSWRKDKVLQAIREDIKSRVEDNKTAFSDIAVLVCTVKSGQQICQILEQLCLPYQTNFESLEENKKLYQVCNSKGENFREKLEELRRRYKAGFWMQGGKIKVCTIHSFKGWELSNILVFFAPKEKQKEAKVALLYTAITRSQQYLTIYNADSYLSPFASDAISKGYIEPHCKTDEIIPF